MGGKGSGGNRVTFGSDKSKKDGLPVCSHNAPIEVQERFTELLTMIPAQAFRKIDAILLEKLAFYELHARKLQVMIDADPTDFKASSVLLRVTEQIMRLSGLFGLSPADRRRINLEVQEEEDEFTSWAKSAYGES